MIRKIRRKCNEARIELNLTNILEHETSLESVVDHIISRNPFGSQLLLHYYYYYYAVRLTCKASPKRTTLMQLKKKCLYKGGYKKFSFESPLEILE